MHEVDIRIARLLIFRVNGHPRIGQGFLEFLGSHQRRLECNSTVRKNRRKIVLGHGFAGNLHINHQRIGDSEVRITHVLHLRPFVNLRGWLREHIR